MTKPVKVKKVPVTQKRVPRGDYIHFATDMKLPHDFTGQYKKFYFIKGARVTGGAFDDYRAEQHRRDVAEWEARKR